MNATVTAAIIYLAIVILGISGWISNIIWTFHQHDMVKLALGILGAVVAPVGAIHGIITWF